MQGPRTPGPPPPTGPDGGRPGWRPSPGYLAIALCIVAGGIAYALMSQEPPSAQVSAASPALTSPAAGSALPQGQGTVVAAASGPASSVAARPARGASGAPATAPPPAPRIARSRDPNGDLTPDITDYINEGETPTMAQVIERLHAAGVRTGLGAFSPPGTRPPLVGLAVPEDFVLPPGYVRHHQATDDGQRIEPVLMFSPDHPFVDANGRPIAIPKDRVVPPEMAPPGLPIRRIVIPAPTESGRPGS